jgi:hypothetical protein
VKIHEIVTIDIPFFFLKVADSFEKKEKSEGFLETSSNFLIIP